MFATSPINTKHAVVLVSTTSRETDGGYTVRKARKTGIHGFSILRSNVEGCESKLQYMNLRKDHHMYEPRQGWQRRGAYRTHGR